MLVKRPGDRPDVLAVTFRFPSIIWAESVHLAGDFNNWSRLAHPMLRPEDGDSWELTLELPKDRQYEYRYLVNGDTWCNDCNADGYVADPYGTYNSVVCT